MWQGRVPLCDSAIVCSNYTLSPAVPALIICKGTAANSAQENSSLRSPYIHVYRSSAKLHPHILWLIMAEQNTSLCPEVTAGKTFRLRLWASLSCKTKPLKAEWILGCRSLSRTLTNGEWRCFAFNKLSVTLRISFLSAKGSPCVQGTSIAIRYLSACSSQGLPSVSPWWTSVPAPEFPPMQCTWLLLLENRWSPLWNCLAFWHLTFPELVSK